MLLETTATDQGKIWYFGSPPDILGEWQGWCPANSSLGVFWDFFEGKRGVSSCHYTVLADRAEVENTATSADKASKQGVGIWNGAQEPGTFPAPRKTQDESSGVHGSFSSSPSIQNEPEELNQALGNLSPGCHTTKCPLCLPNALGVTSTWSRNTESGGAALHRKLSSVQSLLF